MVRGEVLDKWIREEDSLQNYVKELGRNVVQDLFDTLPGTRKSKAALLKKLATYRVEEEEYVENAMVEGIDSRWLDINIRFRVCLDDVGSDCVKVFPESSYMTIVPRVIGFLIFYLPRSI